MKNFKDHNQAEEESLNSILQKIDEVFYFDECNREFYDKDRNAYDIIALINNLEHEKLNIYKGHTGTRYILRKFGFQLLTVYNKEIENLKLRSELDFKNTAISNLNAKLEKTKNALINEKEANSNQKEKINKLNSIAYQKLILSKEARVVNKKLTRLNKTILDYIRAKAGQNENRLFEGSDFTNESVIKQELIKTIKENANLKNALLNSSFQISEIMDYILGKLTTNQ